ncbi:sterile alpha motif-like domain-containing protein [Vagococcus jeotgali]|uniref:sterile alpha motif-like domain-containing protein n=1 Tax=Vagococcus jeotgali TaxID=3109030 RepID=UPI002DDC393F|nr:sterile alpha motif-like domain-containing protein [Vagococcus sp. B2T-5]
MTLSFYQFIQTQRGMITPTNVSQLSEDIFDDLQFPKNETTYHDISEYLETNAYYVTSMDVFDELWSMYEEAKD